MPTTSRTVQTAYNRRTNMLLRSIMLSLFFAGGLAIGLVWLFEAHFGLLDDICRVAYPSLLTLCIVSAAALYRWPETIVVARWIAFMAVIATLGAQFVVAIRVGGPLVGNYPFISALAWLPFAYALALLMLETRHAPWAACGLFALIALACGWRLFAFSQTIADDTALLVKLLASHVVLLACLSGLVRFRLAQASADADSQHFLQQASTDPLTGLANRRHGLDMLRRASRRQHGERNSAVILCDIDRFKEINDRFGHDAGDKVVLSVASALQNSTRNSETVVRWGGDEFLIVVPHIGAQALGGLAERLRTRAAAKVLLDDDGNSISPQLSIGVALLQDGEELADSIKRADAALDEAKAAGRNRCVFAPDGEAQRPSAADPDRPWAFADR